MLSHSWPSKRHFLYRNKAEVLQTCIDMPFYVVHFFSDFKIRWSQRSCSISKLQSCFMFPHLQWRRRPEPATPYSDRENYIIQIWSIPVPYIILDPELSRLIIDYMQKNIYIHTQTHTYLYIKIDKAIKWSTRGHKWKKKKNQYLHFLINFYPNNLFQILQNMFQGYTRNHQQNLQKHRSNIYVIWEGLQMDGCNAI